MPRLPGIASCSRFINRVVFKIFKLIVNANTDVWKEIIVVTQPDVRTGRRGAELAVCM